MDWPVTPIYHLVATIGVIVATWLNIVMYRRSRPDRMKEKIEAALKPINERLDRADSDRKEIRELAAKAEVATKALDHEISGQLREMDEKLDAQGGQLSRVETSVAHMEKHDQGPTLHHRVTELAKQVHGVASAVTAQATQLNMIHTFLLGKSGG